MASRTLAHVVPILTALLVLGLPLSVSGEEPVLDPESLAFFEAKVRPILVERCYSCHSAAAEKVKGNLRLDTRAGWQKGGDIGPAIEPGDPDTSLLVEAVRYDGFVQMPPDGEAAGIGDRRAGEMGRDGRPRPPHRRGPTPAPGSAGDGREGDRPGGRPTALGVPAAANRRAARRSTTPTVGAGPRSTASSSPGLQEHGLSPSERADPVTRIRRAYFDLVGLPPTPEEVADFTDTPTRTPMPAWSMNCSPAPTTANAGRGTGSTWPGSPRATASSTTTTAPPPTTIATSSSRRSTAICPTTRSSRGNSPATNSPPTTPSPSRRPASWRQVSTARRSPPARPRRSVTTNSTT